MKKIGIMGGTFNPIHSGHLIIAQSALECLQLDKILFMPSGNPPHKKNVTDSSIRSEMVKLAIDGNNKFEYSDFELKREGIIYTSDTLSILKKQEPDTELFFIIGADSLVDFPKWHEPEKIAKLCTLTLADRDLPKEKLAEIVSDVEETFDVKIAYIDSPYVSISSTMIRERLNAGRSVKYLVPEKVEQYMLEHRLYQQSDIL